MNFHSLKTRFTIVFIALFLIVFAQGPMIYNLAGKIQGLNKQIELIAQIGEKVIDAAFVLTHHIEAEDEPLESVFDEKMAGINDFLEKLRKGSPEIKPMQGMDVLDKLSQVERKWREINEIFREAMDLGDAVNVKKNHIFDSSYPIVKMMNQIIKKYIDSKKQGLEENINIAGIQRARTFIMAFEISRLITKSDEKSVSGHRAKILETMESFEKSLHNLKNGNIAEKILQPDENVSQDIEEVSVLWEKRKEAINFVLNNRDKFKQVFKDIESTHTREMANLSEALLRVLTAESDDLFHQLFLFVAIATIFAALLIGFTMHFGSKYSIAPLLSLNEMMNKFAQGDLTMRAENKIRLLGRDIKDEIASLTRNSNAMGGKISEMIRKINCSSAGLSSSSTQLLATFEQIGAGMEIQKDQAARVCASIEQLNAAVYEVVINSGKASEGSRAAKKLAEQGEGIVMETIDKIQEIEESVSGLSLAIDDLGGKSKEIGAITKVIDDIADQTNLLALNAAIEAARAGDQGRGFAVVADEVRKLAEKTQQATKEIISMISLIQAGTGNAVTSMKAGKEKVAKGVGFAKKAGESLQQIKRSVEDVNSMITQIAVSMEQQKQASEEVKSSMNQITGVINESASGMNEVKCAVGGLSAMSLELNGLVERFKV